MHEEARVKRHTLAPKRPYVPARPILGLEDLHLVDAREEVGGPSPEVPLSMIAIRIYQRSEWS